MKKTDTVMLAMIVVISVAVSYFVGQTVVGQAKQGNATVETVEPITSAITPPDAGIFNKDAINPAVPINIGDSNNEQPFGQ